MTAIARFQLLNCSPKLLRLLASLMLAIFAMGARPSVAHADGLGGKQTRGMKKSETSPSSRLPSRGKAQRSPADKSSVRHVLDNWPDQSTQPFHDGRSGKPPLAETPSPPVARPSTTTTVEPNTATIDALKRLFRRPADPASSTSRDEIELGARLFSNVQLSADHKMSCATCHDPAHALADGRVRAKGNAGQKLQRNTPALWNAAWQRQFYWDGRSPSLEAQARDAIEREGEMDGTLEAVALWLSRDSSYAGSFERVYRASALADPTLIVRALAAFERSLVSPPTRFDRWIEGDQSALDAREIRGFFLFSGKARCLACHGGWRFTDDSFHDIGLRSTDRRRAALPIAQAADRAFKTPSLRESAWTAPYMHDGSLATFDSVLDHYANRLDRRPSLAPELRAPLTLSASERSDLIAFLRALSSASLPRVP